MNNNLKDNEEFFLINKIIKLDIIFFTQVSITLSNLVKVNNLWYYKRTLLLEILFDVKDYETINFKNKNDNDYRFNNLDIIYKKNNFDESENILADEINSKENNLENEDIAEINIIKNINESFFNMKLDSI